MKINSINTQVNNKKVVQNNKFTFSDNHIKQSYTMSFKGKNNKKEADWISRLYGKTYGKLYDKKWIQKCVDVLNKIPGKMTAHMSAFGSLITSGVYMLRTWHNKDLDPDRRRTLTINQCACFIIPTICAYILDEKLDKKNKAKEYRYSAKQEAKMALSNLSKEEMEKQIARNGARLKGHRALMTLITFTALYRYVTPVLVTPIANKIGDKLNENKKLKEQQRLSIETNNQNNAEEKTVTSKVA